MKLHYLDLKKIDDEVKKLHDALNGKSEIQESTEAKNHKRFNAFHAESFVKMNQKRQYFDIKLIFYGEQ